MKVDSRLAVVILLNSSLICVTQNKATWDINCQNYTFIIFHHTPVNLLKEHSPVLEEKEQANVPSSH